MTEMVNGDGQNLSSFAPAPVNTPSSTPPASAEERTFRQSEVNDLVGRARNEAVERYKRESSMASHQGHPNQQPNYGVPNQGYNPGYQPGYNPGYQPPQQAPQPQYNGMSENEYRRIAAEEARRSRNEWLDQSRVQQQEQDAQRIASEFFTKIQAGKSAIPDFDKVMGDLDLGSIPYHVQLANMVDNTAEVMFELAQNPAKIGQLQSLIDIDVRAGRQPRLALTEMKRLSQSIKDNASAKKFQAPNNPLGQLPPSNAGTGNQGALTVRDYKSKYRV